MPTSDGNWGRFAKLAVVRERLLRLPCIATAVVLGLLATALAATTASANTFTVCASGCDFATITAANASTSVHDGDELIVKPGTYTDAPVLTKTLAVHGEPSQPRPVLAPSSGLGVSSIALGAGSEGSVISHLELAPNEPNDGEGFYAQAQGTLSDIVIRAARAFGSSAPGLMLLDVTATQTSDLVDEVGGGATLRGVTVSYPTTPSGLLLSDFDGAVIEDSTFSSPGNGTPLGLNVLATGQATLHRVRVDGGTGGIIAQGPVKITDTLVTATSGPALRVFSGNAILRNVTAISSGKSGSAPSVGLSASGCSGSGCTPGSIAARNVIARGAEDDISAEAATGSPGAAGAIEIDHSNLRSQVGSVVASAIQGGDPMFVDGTVGAEENFHLRAASPAIDAGVSDPFDGPTDLEGAPRVQGAAIDLGAYELAPPPPTPPAGTPGQPAVSPTKSASPPVVRVPATLALLAHTVKINATHRAGSLVAACTANATDSCAVVGALMTAAGAPKAAARKKSAAIRLGTVTGDVRGAQHGILTVHVTASALALLHRRHSLSASLTATVTSAGGTTKLGAHLHLLLAPARGKR